MERYNEYKESGVQWLGEIPSHWTIMPLKYSGRFCKGKLPSNTNDNCLGKPIIGASEMNGNMPSVYSEDNSVPQCTQNDILFLWDGANAGLVSSFHDGIVASTVTKFTCDNSNIVSTYLYYLEKNYQRYYKERVGGTTIPHMNSQYIASCPLLIPSIQEQQAIADYLDTATTKIDEAIAQQQKMIDLLNERKQIIINNAVTKGLNPDAPMKDSGVDWIGKIPEHWMTRRMRYLCKIKTGDKDTINRVDEGKYPFYVRSPKVERINSYTFDGEAVLMAGDGVGAGKVFHYVNGKFGCHQRVYIFHDIKNINGEYLYFYMKSLFKHTIEQLSAKSTVDSVRLNMIQDFIVAIPTNEEQTSILSYLHKQIEKFDVAIANATKQISLLQERKQIIINDVVTGKVKVS